MVAPAPLSPSAADVTTLALVLIGFGVLAILAVVEDTNPIALVQRMLTGATT